MDFQSTLKENLEFISLIVIYFVSPFINEWSKKLINRRKKENFVRSELDASKRINESIVQLLHRFDAERVWLLNFHNGGSQLPTYRSMRKYSVLFEESRDGSLRYSAAFQGIPLTIFHRYFDELETTGFVKIVAENAHMYSMQDPFVSSETYVNYSIALYDRNREFIGVLGVTYTKPYEMDELQWTELIRRSGIIANQLETYLTSK